MATGSKRKNLPAQNDGLLLADHQALRDAIADAISLLIDLLDAVDGDEPEFCDSHPCWGDRERDCDIEEGDGLADDEPWLGTAEGSRAMQRRDGFAIVFDGEIDWQKAG